MSTYGRYADHHAVDFKVYSESSRRILEGEVPYRDFDLEYPPLALVPFTLPRLLIANRSGSPTIYRGLFLIVILLSSTALAWTVVCLCARLPDCRNPSSPLLLYAVAVTLLGPFLAWRYDLFPALLTALALLAYLHERPAMAGILLGLGIAAKLYPLALAPVFCAEALARRDIKGLVWFVGGAAVAVAAAVAPFALLSLEGLMRMLGYHADRGLEVGSIPSGAGLLAGKLGLTRAAIEFRFGSVETALPWSDAAVRLLPIAGVAALLIVAALAYRRFRDDVDADRRTGPALIACLTLALLAFTITSKVLSPQYVAWMLPFFPLLPKRHALWILLVCALTTAVFPWQFVALLEQRSVAVLLLNARNALLIGGSIWLLKSTRDARARASISAGRRPVP